MLSKARASRVFTKKRTGIGFVYEVSIKGARVSSKAPMAPGDQITALLRLPKHAVPSNEAYSPFKSYD